MTDRVQVCEISAVIMSFSRGANGGSEKLSHLLQVTPLKVLEPECGTQISVTRKLEFLPCTAFPVCDSH
jgi:hypothetical protein